MVRVGFLPGKRVFHPFPWKEMGFYRGEKPFMDMLTRAMGPSS